MIGISGSGKSTWVNNYTKLNNNQIVVSRDLIRDEIFNLKSNEDRRNYYESDFYKKEESVSIIQTKMINESLSKNLNVIVDNTNLKKNYIMEILNKITIDIDIKYQVIDENILTILERNKNREYKVPENIIKIQEKHFNIIKKDLINLPTEQNSININKFCSDYLETKPDMSKAVRDSYIRVSEYLGEINYKNVEEVYAKICKNKKWNTIATHISNLGKISTLLYKNGINVDNYTNFIQDLNKECNKENNQREIIYVNSKNLSNKNIDEFFLKMFLDYPPLRSDLCSIKLKNFDIEKDNYFNQEAFIFNDLVKIKERNNVETKLKIDLKQSEIDFVKSLKTEYLYDINKVENRNDHFIQYLAKISEKYLGERMGIQKFRRLYITKNLNELIKLAPFELLKGAEILAKQMNTSISIMLSNYYGKMEFKSPETEPKETETQTKTPKLKLEDGNYKIIDGILYKKIIIFDDEKAK